MATEKQKRAFKEIVENGRTKGEAMIKAGYSKNTAKAPTKMTKTKGWEELMEECLPDKNLSKLHKKILNKKEKDGQPHSDSIKGLDLAYKLKGKYSAEKMELTLPKPIYGGKSK